MLLTDAEFAPVVQGGAGAARREPLVVVDIDDAGGAAPASALGAVRYEDLLAEGDPAFAWPGPQDEWDALALLYTSGTTGDPKGVVYHHRGAYLNALGNALAFRLDPDSVYLWTLPMFHCYGWTYTWAVTAAGGTHVCLRARRARAHLPAIREHRVTHMCGAPIVLNLLVHAPAHVKLALRPRGRRRDRRRGAAVGRHRGDGGDGLPRDAPLRAHRVLRARHAVRAGRTTGRRCR